MKDARKTRYDFNKLTKRLVHGMGQAIADYGMIEAHDRIMVAVSGGKDSLTLLSLLLNLQKRAPVPFEICAVHLDQKQPAFPVAVLKDYFDILEIPYVIIGKDTYGIVKRIIPEQSTPCGLCSRLRRGTLYEFAVVNGFNKIALGHHRDDLIETLFLNMFHGGVLKSMPPKLLSDDLCNCVIRPLAYCRENDIKQYAQQQKLPVIPCTFCGSQPNMQRQAVKAMLAEWETQYPGRMANIFQSMTKLRPSQLADTEMFDFKKLEIDASMRHERRETIAKNSYIIEATNQEAG